MKLTFENLSTEGYVAFALAIIFTIISIAGFIIFARHKNLNKWLSMAIALVFPFFAIFYWVYLILNVLKYETVMALSISIGSAAGYVLLALCLALIINACIKHKQPKEKKEEQAPVEENVEQAAESHEEAVEETKLLTMQENLMLDHSEEEAEPLDETADAATEAEATIETVEEPVEGVEEHVEEPVEVAEEHVEEQIEDNDTDDTQE